MDFCMPCAHEIVICPSDNMGYTVKIGICRMVYTDEQRMWRDLREYVRNSEAFEAARRERTVRGS